MPTVKLSSAGKLATTHQLWKLLQGMQEKNQLKGHRSQVWSVSFSPDGQTLASASDNGTVILYDLKPEHLLVRSCNWLRDHLKYNRDVTPEERALCDDIPTALLH
ncbi:MAG: hypothetical protein F6K42_25095 [Leptolyngbya sp. SIO1D8]|nr:hypothetical protein [Leptolyngbya sp. SIO1D8]